MKRNNRRRHNYDCMIRVGGAALGAFCVIVTLVAAFAAVRGNETRVEEENNPAVLCETDDVVCETEEVPEITGIYEEPAAVAHTAAVPHDTEELICLGEFRVTAYCSCEKCCGVWAKNRPTDEEGNEIVYTASGAVAQEGVTIAVDPAVIPYGTKVVIDGSTYTAQDTGGALEGNHVDIYFATHEKACEWGLQHHEVFLAEVLK